MIPLFGFSQSKIRVNYFGDIQFEKGKRELVIIAQDPQTEFAENFGARIYTDDASFKTIHETFYTLVDTSQEQVVDFCGFDIFFYLKIGPNLKLIKSVNSNCSDAELSFLDQLAVQGEPLRIDTLNRENLGNNLAQIVADGAILIANPDQSFQLTEITLFNNGINFPLSLYDGFFPTTLSSKEAILVKNHLNNFMELYIDESIENKLINWQINLINEKKWRPHFYDVFYTDFKTTELTVTVYLSKKYFSLFKDQEITMTDSKAASQGPWIVYRKSHSN